MAVPSESNGVPLGTPMPAHDLQDAGGMNKNGYYSVGANPPPAWSNYIGPSHKAPPVVATQLVVPTELSDAPVDLTCVHCQHHTRTVIKTKNSMLAWGICTYMCCTLLCLPCALLPLCLPKFKITEHFCGNCGRLLGKYKGWKGRAGPWGFVCFLRSANKQTNKKAANLFSYNFRKKIIFSHIVNIWFSYLMMQWIFVMHHLWCVLISHFLSQNPSVSLTCQLPLFYTHFHFHY